MTLTFLNVGTPELTILLAGLLFLLIAVGNFGKDTPLGYWGSILLSVIATPVVGFFVVLLLRSRRPA